MQRTIDRYISQHIHLPYGAKVLIALSGGADSVALLHIMRRLGYECIAVHCNFHLRNEESMRDQHFVEELCKRLDTQLTVVDFNTEEYARENKVSIEMAARSLRYNVFEEIRRQQAAVAIAVAHHRDDTAETLLLNLIRGCGIKGLHGIRPRNGHIVRPLLAVGRNDILQYLKKIGEDYVTDSSNLKCDYTRNKVRLELIPLMAQINPSITQSLAETADRIAEAEEIYNKAIEESIGRVFKKDIIDIEALKKECAPKTLLYEILSPLGFNSAQVADIFNNIDSDSGRRFKAEPWVVVKDRNKLIIVPDSIPSNNPIVLPQEGEAETPDGFLIVKKGEFNGIIPKQSNIATLDADKVRLPLTVRVARNGDRFHPFGMRGTKLVSDYLTDRKRNIIEKEHQLVVTDAQGEIIWLVNERPSALCSIDKKTENTITIEYKQK